MNLAGLRGVGMVVLVSSLTLGAAQSPANSPARVISVRAERFAFSPSEIRLTQGETVEFRIKSDDTAHGFRIIGTDTDIVVPKRGKGEVRVVFRAATAGEFTFECNQMCGAGHHCMRHGVREQTSAGGGAR